MAGRFTSTPKGIILHSTRSTVVSYDERAEWDATVRYVQNGAGGLGWNITVGPDCLAEHIGAEAWGWNARAHSSEYLAIEFAQPVVDRPISDAAVMAAAWWIEYEALSRWPKLPRTFPQHSELPAGIADGKTDPFPRGDSRGEDLRRRLLSLL